MSANEGFPAGQQERSALAAAGVETVVRVINNADAIAAGLAATRGYMEKLVRVWTLGDGIGFGRYPQCDEPWEAGHAVVTLDPRERYCGCGGVGHLEGIMGNRAMRLRFLDLERRFSPRPGRRRPLRRFVRVWHRALAASSATNPLEARGGFLMRSTPRTWILPSGALPARYGEDESAEWIFSRWWPPPPKWPCRRHGRSQLTIDAYAYFDVVGLD